MRSDTIFALASGAGRAGVAVYRLSGPAAGDALCHLSGRALPAPRQAVRRRLADAKGQVLDEGLVLWFPGPASFTGEDVVELHLHGGRAVGAGVIAALMDLGLRPAEPGEFSRRAFEAGKLDLTQAEAIADLVDADTAAQRRQALVQLEGGLSRLYDDWRARLIAAQAHLEAQIDFAEEDLPDGVEKAAREALRALGDEMAGHLRDGGRGERLRDGFSVVLAGAPNAGKSSLLNRIAGREAAIVSATAGTTRDVIEVHLDLGGYPVLLADTAGLREAEQAVEEEGVRRARRRAEVADLCLVVIDCAALPEVDDESLALIRQRGAGALVVLNKIDCRAAPLPAQLAGQPVLPVSAATGAGLDALLAAMAARTASALEGSGSPALTRARHRNAIEEARQSLVRALAAPLPELAAEDIRMAVRAVGRITGRVDVEEMLDVIFRDFCIGK